MSSALLPQIQEKFVSSVVSAVVDKGDVIVTVKRESLQEFLKALRSGPEFDFNMLMDIFAVDYLHWEEKEVRFEVTYNLFSLSKNQRLFVRVAVPETDPSLDSAVSVWPAADWYEREVWDMMGIVFKGHPNLKRILMYEGFEGHPLRKDYPYNRRQPIIGPLN